MAKINDKGETVIELKCEKCPTVCGTITYPVGTLVNEDQILATHSTRCDIHK